MDANERWRRASESADRFSPFRRRPPVFVGLLTALVALISLAVFLGVAGLDIGQFWIAALVSITAMMLAGSGLTLLGNHKAKSSYIGEYRRLNKPAGRAAEFELRSAEMMFVFAYLGSLSTPPDWPVNLMYATEAVFVIVPFACVFLAWRGVDTQLKRDMVAAVAGISASFALIMPFELAPFFFRVPGEIMLGTVGLILAYPFAAVLFVFLFRIFMKVTHRNTAG